MKIFLDTSSLFKLYHQEIGTDELDHFLSSNKVTLIHLSEIAKIEFVSTLMKKIRQKEVTELKAKTILEIFEVDSIKFSFVAVDSFIIEQARKLIYKYATQGLRTLDGIQLATAVSLAHKSDLFYTNDTVLKTIFEMEGLPTK
jgi:uncharacterized protein